MRTLVLATALTAWAANGADAASTTTKWVEFKNDQFSFVAPSDLKDEKVRGQDSLVGKFSSKGLELLFDYGWWSFTFAEWSKATKYEDVIVDGRKARIGTVREPMSYSRAWSTQIFIPEVWPKKPEPKWDQAIRLSIYVNCATEDDVAIAHRIFKSVKFREKR